MILEELFCLVDDFCKEMMPEWEQRLLSHGLCKRIKPCRLSASEIMTIIIHFHQSQYRHFKAYYRQHVIRYLKGYFPHLVSYNRFVELMKSVIVPLTLLIQCLSGEKTGIYFIDSTPIKVCHIKREHQHKTFAAVATKGKSTVGWFYGFKLHLVINDKGEIMAFKLTQANVDDRVPVKDLTQDLIGKLIGDKGYLSQDLFDALLKKGIQLITRVRKNMKGRLMTLWDKMLLRKRALIESVNDQLKNISQIEHTRHRSVWNFIVNLLAGLVAYSLQPKKPSLNLNPKHAALLTS